MIIIMDAENSRDSVPYVVMTIVHFQFSKESHVTAGGTHGMPSRL